MCSGREKIDESRVHDDRPKIDMRNIQLSIDQKTERNQIENDCRGDKAVAKLDTRQTFRAAMILGDGLEDDAPPKVAVDLNIPVVPAGVGRVTPAFFLEQ